jgi:hypothetical protein
LDVTLPPPLPAKVTVKAGVFKVKVAVTARAAVIVATQVLVPVQAPDHPANVEEMFGAAVSVTTVP